MRNFVILSLLCFSFFSCEKPKPMSGNFEIKGAISGLKKGKIFIMKEEDGQWAKVDSVLLSNSSDFQFDLTIDEPQIMALVVDRGTTNSLDNEALFFAEPGTMEIYSSLNEFYNQLKITGSEHHTIYERYLKEKNRITNQSTELKKQLLIAEKNNENELVTSTLNSLTENEFKRIIKAVHFSLTYPDSEVSAYIALSDILPYTMKYTDTIYNKLTPRVQQSKYGKKMKQLMEMQEDSKK